MTNQKEENIDRYCTRDETEILLLTRYYLSSSEERDKYLLRLLRNYETEN